MEQFRLKRSNQTTSTPLVRVSAPYYRLLCQLKAETGLSMSTIIGQCIDYALEHGDDRDRALLTQFTGGTFRCPLLGEEDNDDT